MAGSSLRVGWEFHPNDSRATMHVDDPLFSCSRLFGLDKCSEREVSLFESLCEVRGVKEVSIYKYQISIQRGAVFSWHEITPRVEAIVREWCGADEVFQVHSLAKHNI